MKKQDQSTWVHSAGERGRMKRTAPHVKTSLVQIGGPVLAGAALVMKVPPRLKNVGKHNNQEVPK